MSLISKKSLIDRIRRGRQARARMVASNLAEGIASQIRATRDAQDLSQSELARETGMSQNNLSRLESPDYGKHTISSLKRIADALDVALVVRFVPFSQYIDWLSGTPRMDPGLSPQSLAVPSFDREEAMNNFFFFDVHKKQITKVITLPVPSGEVGGVDMDMAESARLVKKVSPPPMTGELREGLAG